jgi:hypothetical protein
MSKKQTKSKCTAKLALLVEEADLYAWLVQKTCDMLDHKETETGTEYAIKVCSVPGPRLLCFKLQWECGYDPDPDPDNKYLVETEGGTYGLTVGVFAWQSSYMMMDWHQLSDTCTMHDDFEGILQWLLKCCEELWDKETLLPV